MIMRRLLHLARGSSLMEILLAVAIFVLGMTTIATIHLESSANYRLGSERAKANRLAVEGLEAARAIRDASWGSITAGTKGLAISGNAWSFSGTSDTQDGYTRSVQISAADADSWYVTSTVMWNFRSGQTATSTYTTLLTNWHETTSSGGGSWSSATVVATTTVPGSIPAQALAVNESTNRLYVGTPVSATGSEFYIYDISIPNSPAVLGQLELGKSISALTVSGTRVYAASDTNPDEVKIINVSSSTNPVIINTITLTGNSNVNGMVTTGTQLQMVRSKQGLQSTYYVYSLANELSPSLLGSLYLGDGAGELALSNLGSYAFMAGHTDAQEFQFVNFSSPGTMVVGGSSNAAGTENFTTVNVSGTNAYAGSLARVGNPEFFTYNISTPTAPTELGSLEVGADINRSAINATQPNLVFLATASSTAEFLIVDVSSPASPSFYNRINLPATATAIALTSSTAYIATESGSASVVEVQP
jgi:Tfp pilus assembly protein PilV